MKSWPVRSAAQHQKEYVVGLPLSSHVLTNPPSPHWIFQRHPSTRKPPPTRLSIVYTPSHLLLLIFLLTLDSNDNEQVFTWVTEDATLYFDSHETVRIRVEEETWHDQAPTKATGGENGEDDSEKGKHAPYGIIASMEESGLGPCLWWDGGEEEEEESWWELA